MALAKKQHEGFARFFEAPTREGLRDLLKNNIGETDYLDFKESWPSFPKVAKHILALANSGGGGLVVGAKEREGGGIEASGLAAPTDKADIAKALAGYLPNTVKYEILDFAYEDSEYPSLKGKAFQVVLVEFDPKYLPLLALKEGEGIKRNMVYVRNGTSTTEAGHEELQRIINARVATGHSTKKSLQLTEHIEQLKILDKERPRHIGRRDDLMGFGRIARMFAAKNSDDLDEFLGSLYIRKKKLVERELGL